jgi:hypothetical protein
LRILKLSGLKVLITKHDVFCKALSNDNEVEATVVQKLNQGTIPKTGRHRFRVCFFGSFLHKQKRTNNNIEI